MRFAFVLAAALLAAPAFAADAPELDDAMCLHGKVLETFDVDVYTYARIAIPEGETWVAVDHAPVSVGAEIAIAQGSVMKDFWSRQLQRTFEWIVFGRLVPACPEPGMPAAALDAQRAAGVGSASEAAAAHRAAGVSGAVEAAAAHRAAGVTVAGGGAAAPASAPAAAPGPVAKAEGVDGRTVAEVVMQAAALDEKPVAVRGRVVRYTAEVMGKNWLHLRDGSGSAADGSDDVLVTTTAPAKVGDVVLARGIVRTNRDFGAGYAYKVVIEDATLGP